MNQHQPSESKFYNISKGQFIMMWLIASIVAISAYAAAETNGYMYAVIGLIFGFMIFYSIGWNNSNKN